MGEAGGQQVKVKWSAGTQAPRLRVPANTIDCHHHIYDSRFPMIPNAVLQPPDALVADYRMLQKRLGIGRHVVVQPSTYGVDNRLLMESLQTFGLQEARGVAVVNTAVTDEDLKQLDTYGVRGIRFNLVQGGGTAWEMVDPLARRVAALGWHIQIQADGKDIFAHKSIWDHIPCSIVFDHLAHIPEPEGVKAPVFAVVTDLLHKGKAWVKLSGFYYDTRIGPPAYADSVAVAQKYVQEAPERLVWGSDWPHPVHGPDEKPDDALLLDLLAQVAPDESTRNHILVNNPATLYGF
jgi:predicted TIM-barrel fold metal-dependent hydrolase